MTGAPMALRARAELELRRRRESVGAVEVPPTQWKPWLRRLFPHWFDVFAPHHEDYWDWIWSVERDVRPQPFVGIWSRGHGKSTGAEAGTAAVGLRAIRRYALYVCATQDAADKRVTNIGTLLESAPVSRYYPVHAQRKVSKYGHSIGWRRDRLVTSGGFVVDAAGLDSAVRGLKFEEQRPDFIVFDDIDGKHDSPAVTKKKLETITHTILPAAAPGAAVLAIQNLIIPHGIFSQLSDGRADFLADRFMSGPHPAIRDLKTELREDDTGRRRVVVTGGRPTWKARGLAWAQDEINTTGFRAFREECQHEVQEREGALWKRDMITRRQEVPPLKRVVVGVDPSGGANEIGIIGAGLGHDGRAYVVRDDTQRGKDGPLNWGRAAVGVYDDLEGDLIAAERNFGGEMVESNIRVAAGKRHVPVKLVHASRGKDVRAEPVASLYSEGLVDHIGTFPELEAEMTGWVPGDPDSPNRLDALVWALTELMLTERPELPPRASSSHITI